MKANTIRALRRDCLRVMGADPMAAGATFAEAKRQLEAWLQRQGLEKRYSVGLSFSEIPADPSATK